MSTLSRPNTPSTPDLAPHPELTDRSGLTTSPALARVVAVIRLSLGFVFLWAFLDKAFALGFDTGKNPTTGVVDRFGSAAWIHGASPTSGFLGKATKGPLADFYHSFAGSAWADWLFMIGLLGIGLALMLGIGMRIAAVSGSVLLVLMWSAVLPPANHPFMDDHLVYALVLIALAMCSGGRPLGFGRAWERLGMVERYPVLK